MTPIGLPKDGFWVYLIVNRANGKIYVGKTKNPSRRCQQYIYDFKARKIGHINDHLLKAMSKYGIDNFDMILHERCRDEDHLFERELRWIDLFRTTDRNRGYNLRRDSSTGMIVHPETSEKIRTNLRNQWAQGLRSDHARKLSDSWARNPERRRAQGRLLSKLKTKYKYIATNGEDTLEVDYRWLVDSGFGSVISSFHRSQSDIVEFKGNWFKRIPVCQN